MARNTARQGLARQGSAWHGKEHGGARHGKARLGGARQGTRLGVAGRGQAWRGEAWQGAAWNKARVGIGSNAKTKTRVTAKRKDRIMKTYEVKLTGETPIIMHHDNLAWDGILKQWQRDPANKAASVAGDDRSPAFRWIGYLYRNAGKAVLPSDNLMTMLREGGAKCPTGKGQQTFKALTQSGLVVDQAQWDLCDPRNGKPYNVADVDDLIAEPDFETHEAYATKRGFLLFVKRAKVGTNKHVRVRPRFDAWTASGTITVLDAKITKDVLKNILTFGGAYSGLCDWRPSSPKSPGSFGRFTVTIK